MPERIFKEAALPELKKDVVRLISMRHCPFAQRVRLVLTHKQIPHETFNADILNKKDWLLKLNPLGAVPILVKNDEVIIESLICNDWLEANYATPEGSHDLAASSVAESFRWRCLTAMNDSRVVGKFYAHLRTIHLSDDSAVELKARETLQNGIRWLSGELGDQAYFAGEQVGLVDYNLYPWFERMTDLDKWAIPKITAWRSRMQQLPTVKATMYDITNHAKFYELYTKAKGYGTSMDFDFDLDTEYI